ncbi:hypothetical protein [Pseudomonas entomophila]|uniref:hypothetical protein n=1 Tax=Pseudomonas entomophila TaxID=312306 RepID=UPI001F01D3B5|nr:hypothetical protein [Pseudomonas entomophila]MCG8294011.1 hypothetical protein [Pseudomonas entomophila]
MIIKENAIGNQGGLWVFRGVPYTGRVLTFANGKLVEGRVYEDGCYVDVIRSDFFLERGRDGIEIERDYTGEQFYWEGRVYDGFCYEFIGDICVSERLYEFGWVIEEVTYFSDGQLHTVEVGEEVPQSYEWFEGGGLKAMTAHQNNIFMLSLKFSLEGLERLTLMGDYFGNLPKVAEHIRFPVLRDKIEIATLRCAGQVSLNGSGIDDGVVDYLFRGENERRIQKLEFDGVNCSSALLQCLKRLEQLNDLKVVAAERGFDCWRDGCAQLQMLRPGCDVCLNGKVLLPQA